MKTYRITEVLPDGSRTQPFGEEVHADSAIVQMVRGSELPFQDLQLGDQALYSLPLFPGRSFLVCLTKDTALKCFFASESCYDADAGCWFVAKASDQEDGYWRTNYTGYNSLAEAQGQAQALNDIIGVSKDLAKAITSQSIAMSIRKEAPVNVAKAAIDVIRELLDAACVDLPDVLDKDFETDDFDVDKLRDILESLGCQCLRTTEGREWLKDCYPDIYKLASAE